VVGGRLPCRTQNLGRRKAASRWAG
jgi:hypothetical protein